MAKIEKPVQFTEAIDFFKAKVKLPTQTWTDLWEDQHARAFVIAGATKDAMLEDFQGALTKALENGTTLAEFQKDFDRITTAHGWEYNGSSGWRSRVIYQTNLKSARAAGRWKQIQSMKKRRPWLRYTALQDDATRDAHEEWHGTLLSVEDPWWRTHAPLNGWGCRCKLQSLSDRDLTRYKFTPSKKAPPVKMEDRLVNTPVGKINRPTPAGIDTGFGYNVGEAAWGNELSNEAMAVFKKSGTNNWTPLTKKTWAEYDRPEAIPVDATKSRPGETVTSKEGMAKAISKALGDRDEVTFSLKDGSKLAVDTAELAAHLDLSRAPMVPYMKEVIENPFEIWIAFEKHKGTGRVVLRKRLIKIVDIPKQGQMMFVANARKGRFEGWTFVPVKNTTRLQKQRYGILLYGRD